MAEPTDRDREEAAKLYPLSYMGPHLRDVIAQALADRDATARAEGAAEEREASKLCPNCVVLAGWKPGDRCAARWWSTISDCELVCEDPATHATIAAPTCSRHARDGALPIDEFFREEDIIRRRLAAIRSRGPAPERPAVGSCGWHPCGTCADKRASMKPAPVDPDPDLPYSHVPGKVVAKYRATRVDEDAPVDPVREAARVTGSEWAAVAKAWRAFREKYGEWEPWSRSPLVLRLNNVEPVALTAALDALAAALEKSE